MSNTDKPSSFVMPRAPPHVYSCFVKNQTSEPMECYVQYYGQPKSDTFNELVTMRIEPNEEKLFERKFFQPNLPDSYCKWVKIIQKVLVKNLTTDQTMELTYPFPNVRSPIRNWEFHVNSKEILSKPPSRPVNVLQYQNNEYI